MDSRLGSSFPQDGFEWWVKFMGRTAVSTRWASWERSPAPISGPICRRSPVRPWLITTEQSGLATVEETRAWQQQIADSELLVLPGNSYHVAATHADRAAEATLDFLARRGGG